MVRVFARFLACILVLGFSLQAAEAARWLRIIEKDPNRGGKYAWFDVDTIVYEKKNAVILVRSAVLKIKEVRAGGVNDWHLWGVDCKASKAYQVGASVKGSFAQATDWKTDPKKAFALSGEKTDRVVAALGNKVCAWADAWPAGEMP